MSEQQGKMVSSTSDERVANNTMRHQYRVLSDQEKACMQAIKDHGLNFLTAINSIETINGAAWSSREIEISRQKIEEAVMWAVKHITK